MKIKLLVSRAGSDFSQNIGDIIEVGNDEASRMIEAGQAIPFSEPVIERAIKTPKGKETR